MHGIRSVVTGLAVVLTLAICGWAQAPAQNGQSGQMTVIAGPVPQNVTDNQATIWWQTSAPGATIVKYGTDQHNLNQTAQQPWGNESHSVQLTNLQPNTTYWFRVERPSGENLGDGFFKTEPSGAQNRDAVRIIDGPRIEFIAQDHAVIAWTTNAPSSSVVRYSTDQNNLSQTAEEPWGQTTHRVTIRGLQPNQTYYFAVESGQGKNTTGQTAASRVGMFRTNVGPEGLKISTQH